MEGYGFAIRSVSTYNVVTQEARGGVKKPLGPFDHRANSNSEEFLTRKKPVPITGKPYDYDDHDRDHDDDYKKHGSSIEAYPVKGDNERHRAREKSPDPGFPRKVDEFIKKVRSSFLAEPNSSHSTRPNPCSGYGGDCGSDKEGRKPIGGANRNGSYDDPNGYGGGYNNKEGLKPSSSPIQNEKYDGYDGANKGYGGYGNNNNKEGYKPTSSPTRNGKYDGANKGFGGYGNNHNKEGRNPISPDQNDKYEGYDGAKRGYGGYGDYNNKGYKPTSIPTQNGDYDGANKGYGGYGDYNNKGNRPTSSPTWNGEYDGANKGYGGYGDYNNKGNKPTSSPTQNGEYDGANKGYGGYGHPNIKEGYKPTSSPTRSDNYGILRPADNYGGAMDPNKSVPSSLNKPKIGTTWTKAPRKGVILSEATNSLDKAIELLKQAAINDQSSNEGGTKTTDTALPYDGYDNYQRKHDGVDRSAPRNNWAASLGNDSRGKVDNTRADLVKEAPERRNGIAAGPPQPQFSVPKPGIPNRNFPSRPLTHVIDGRQANYDRGPIIDSRVAEKKLGGTRI